MVVVQVLRTIKNAALAFHRWFMKYSGTTMIIDSIEDRRRGRREEEQPGDSSASSGTDSASPK